MCMKCGCSTPNDKKTGAMDCGGATGAKTVIVPPTDSRGGGYDGNNGY